MNERLVFRCPCCGQIAPADRLGSDGTYPLEVYIHRWGGKRPFTDDERLNRRDKPFKRGSAPGQMSYEKVGVSPEIVEAIRKRATNLLQQLHSED